MNLEWIPILVNAFTTIVCVGGIGWIFTIKEDKKSKKLDNEAKEIDIKEKQKDEIIRDWKEIADERKSRCVELEDRCNERDEIIANKDEIISELRTKLDERNTYCAVAELMRCEEVSCINRKPPFGMKEAKISEKFE